MLMGAKKYYLINLSDNSEIILNDKIVIGRKEFPEDKKMSKYHCEVSLTEDNILSLKDLGSKNKTWLNDESIPAQRLIKIYLEDIIKIGRTKFKVQADGLTTEESFTHTHGRTSKDEFTFIIENPITAHEEPAEEEEEDTGHSITFINTSDDHLDKNVGTGIAHTMSKMVKTTFGIIKQRYTSTTNRKRRSRENEIEIDPAEEKKIELNSAPLRGPGAKGRKYQKLKKLEQKNIKNRPRELSGKPELVSSRGKLLILFIIVGTTICYFLTSK